MTVARSSAAHPAPERPSRRRTRLAALPGALLAIAGIGLAASPAVAEEIPVSSLESEVSLPPTGVDGTDGLLAAGALLVLAGGLAIIARRRTGPHAD